MATTTVAPIYTEQINKTFYVGFGSLHSIQEAVDDAVASGHPSLVVIPQGYWGGDLISDVVNGTDWIYLTDQRGWNPFYYLWEDNQYRGPFINLDGKLTKDTVLDTNGFALYLGGTDASNATMIQDGGTISAPNANFAAATVDGSPVRTFENTGDPGTGATYPPAGIAVSTGSGWGSSIPATAFLPVSGGTMTGVLTMGGAGEPYIRFNNQNAQANARLSDIRCTTYSMGMYFVSDDQSTNNYWIGANRNGATPTDITLNGNVWINNNLAIYGNAAFSGSFWLNRGGDIIYRFADPASGYPNLTFNAIWSNANERLYDINCSNNFALRFLDDTNNAIEWMTAYRTGNVCSSIWFSASLNAPAKNFVIPHPSNEDQLLVHSCLEGPEHAVFYRGEGQTKKGETTITLPDYFEALTLKEGRTVQVTPLFEDDNDTFAPVAASRVKDGKFRVISNGTNQKFYWEVKAIRSDLGPLAAVQPRRDESGKPVEETPQKKAKRVK